MTIGFPCSIIALEDGSKFIDKQPRATLRVHGADTLYQDLRFTLEAIGLTEGVALGRGVEIELHITH